MKILVVILMCTISNTSIALARFSEFHEFRERGVSCKPGKLDACIVENQAAALSLRTQFTSLDPQLAALSGDLAIMERDQAMLQSVIALVGHEIRALEAEKKFLELPQEPVSTALLPGFPTLEDFFTLHPLDRSWRERFSGERLKNLIIRLRETEAEKSDYSLRLARFTGEFERLTREKQSVQAQRNDLVTRCHQHEAMWSAGCKDSYCPSGN